MDGILADLGVSSHQFDVAERGFSTRFDGELDLRMDQREALSAKQIVNEYSDTELAKIFRLYGELSLAPALAKAICNTRSNAPINTTFELKDAVKHLLPRNRENKFLAMIFQALRIEVNGELVMQSEANGKILKMNVSGLASGLYFIKSYNGQTYTMNKIQVK